MSTKKLTGAQLKKFRSDVAALKAKGLVSKRIDARSQKPTRHMQEQVKKFSDVLTGKAKVVHAPTRARAKEYESNFRTKGRSIVVPVEKGERVVYAPKTGEIHGFRERGGKRIKKLYSRKKVTSAYDLPQGKNLLYTIPFGNKGKFTFDSIDELAGFMAGYDRYTNWQQYVEVEMLDGPSGDAEE